jgi:hypothetical protein
MAGLHRLAGVVLTFAAICFTWVFFRSESFDRSLQICQAMLGLAPADATRFVGNLEMLFTLPPILALLASHWVLRDSNLERAIKSYEVPAYVYGMASALMIVCIAFSSGEDRAFIYFQF